MYDKGQGVARDYAEAIRLFRLAADQGVAAGQIGLGFRYAQGQGVAQDYVEAVRWFRLAADGGDPEGQYNLGFMYAKGQGVPKDYIQAHLYFSLAAAQGMKEAVRNRDIIAGKMTVKQIAEAQRLARAWKPKSAPGTR